MTYKTPTHLIIFSGILMIAGTAYYIAEREPIHGILGALGFFGVVVSLFLFDYVGDKRAKYRNGDFKGFTKLKHETFEDASTLLGIGKNLFSQQYSDPGTKCIIKDTHLFLCDGYIVISVSGSIASSVGIEELTKIYIFRKCETGFKRDSEFERHLEKTIKSASKRQ